ncbi:MAG: hypothetical protein K2X77_10185 [Candidatus Obscuribacterales bacterium]|nr:hypothetical protein [Candidatus Obscuribacterales bacterium]
MTFDMDKAINTAIDNHKPQGDNVSKEAVGSMMADVLKSYQDNGLHGFKPKGASVEYANSMADKLQEKLAAYGVTNLQIVDMNGNGFVDKGDKLQVATKDDLVPTRVEYKMFGVIPTEGIVGMPAERLVSMKPHEHHAKPAEQHNTERPSEQAPLRATGDQGPVLSHQQIQERADHGASLIDQGRTQEFQHWYTGQTGNMGPKALEEFLTKLNKELKKHGHQAETMPNQELLIDGKTYFPREF